MSFYRTSLINSDKNLRAYVVGLAIGDGNLSKVRKTTRLRISCDTKYPNLIKGIVKSLQQILPENKVNKIKKKGNCLDVYVYSNHLEKLLGWNAGSGPKFKQGVRIPEWIRENIE